MLITLRLQSIQIQSEWKKNDVQFGNEKDYQGHETCGVMDDCVHDEK